MKWVGVVCGIALAMNSYAGEAESQGMGKKAASRGLRLLHCMLEDEVPTAWVSDYRDRQYDDVRMRQLLTEAVIEGKLANGGWERVADVFLAAIPGRTVVDGVELAVTQHLLDTTMLWARRPDGTVLTWMLDIDDLPHRSFSMEEEGGKLVVRGELFDGTWDEPCHLDLRTMTLERAIGDGTGIVRTERAADEITPWPLPVASPDPS